MNLVLYLITQSMDGESMQRMFQNTFVSNFTVRGDFSIVNGRIIYCNRIVVPSALRSEVLDRIHDGHQSVTKSRERANMAVWWPDVSRGIQNKVSTHANSAKRIYPNRGKSR